MGRITGQARLTFQLGKRQGCGDVFREWPYSAGG